MINRNSIIVNIFYFVIVLTSGTINAGNKHGWSAMHNGGLQFTENKGQIIDQEGKPQNNVLYTGDVGNGTKIYFRKNTISYVQSKVEGLEENEEEEMKESMETGYDPAKEQQEKMEHAITKIHRIDVAFLNTNTNVKIIAEDKTKDYTNYFLPQCKDGVTARSFLKLTYREIYPHIDVVFKGGTKDGMEYDIIVKPGANPDDIRIKYNGADKIELRGNTLVIQTGIGEIKEVIPETYQLINGEKQIVAAGYQLIAINQKETTLNFKHETFNSSYPLIIDPWVTYYGGNSSESSAGVDTDSEGNILVSGFTTSANFPVSGAYQAGVGGSMDAFVVKLNSTCELIWATYYGGSGSESGFDVAVDNSNNVLVCGNTNSPNLPTVNAFQNALGSPTDCFMFKLSSSGTSLIWATYYGGEEDIEYANAISYDTKNNILVTGFTYSTGFPVSPAAFQSLYADLYTPPPREGDAYVLKFDSTGTRQFATYVGGILPDIGMGITADKNDAIIIVGQTYSSGFPVLNAFQSIHKNPSAVYGNPSDAFVSKFSPSGTLIWSTFYGGKASEYFTGIDADPNNNLFIVGLTMSTDMAVFSAYQPQIAIGAYGIQADVFLMKMNSGGNPIWATFFGGTFPEEGNGVVADGVDGSVYIAGDTYSSNLPVTPCATQFDLKDKGNGSIAEDNYMAHFDSTGQLLCSGYVGGDEHDETSPNNLAVYGENAYIVGGTFGNYPITAGAWQTFGGGTDAFIVQFCNTNCSYKDLVSQLNFSADNFNICSGDNINFTDNSTLCALSNVFWQWYFPGGVPSTSNVQNPMDITYTTPGTYNVKLVVYTPCGDDSITKTTYINVYAPLSLNSSANTTVCDGDNIVLTVTASGGSGVYSYSWEPGGQTGGSITVAPSTTTTYTASASTNFACASGNKSFTTVHVHPVPTALFTYEPTDPEFIDIIYFKDQSINNINSWNWSFGDPDNSASFLTDPSFSYPDTGAYTVKLIVSDINECTDTIIKSIDIKGRYLFFVPNSFTPDGDNVNDIFRPYSSIVSKFSMIIFDRWGNRIFESSDINKGWDGKIKGVMAMEDVYVYVANLIDFRNEPRKYAGHLNLIR